MTTRILSKLKNIPVFEIDKVEAIFGQVKKPYLDKRHNLNLFIGRKQGDLVKEAPQAYGYGSGKHYYFVHAYNCLFECEYCYLQGYFKSPDLVFFVNHDEIAQQMLEIGREAERSGQEVWFHAGEFSDSLALSQLTGELPIYWDVLKQLPNAWLELRSKSAQIAALKELPALPNVVLSFSLSPEKQVKTFEHKTASLKARLDAAAELAGRGFKIGLHFDPVILSSSFEVDYRDLLAAVAKSLPVEALEYASLLGWCVLVVRAFRR